MKKKYFTAKARRKGRTATHRAWVRSHPAENKIIETRKRKKNKQRAFAKLGNKCANPACQWLNADGSRGCIDQRCLQIDHVKGDAPSDKRKNLFSERLYRFIIKTDCAGRYQLLCANCNWIKRHVNHEHR
jgi:hypothetical protein